MQQIRIRGARTHNLKNIDLDLPRDKLIVITGLSGSGKSSLAFNTLYAEGQRRYVESLSAYARQFLSMMEKPDVDLIEGLSPAISIEQKTTSHNPRSTVGTVTEIYDYLRLLFARVGQPRCPKHGITLEVQTVTQMVDSVLSLPEETKIMLFAPVVRDRKGEHKELLQDLLRQGFVRARIDGKVTELSEAPKLELHKKHSIDVVIDRIKVRPDAAQRLADSFETALRVANGLAGVAILEGKDKIAGEVSDDRQVKGERTALEEQGDGFNTKNKKNSARDQVFSAKFACPECGYSLTALEPRLFSFNNPAGACPECDGVGTTQLFDENKIVCNPELSLTHGAIRGWNKNNPYFFSLLTSLATHYGFDLEVPFIELPQKIHDVILHGSGDEVISFCYLFGHNKRHVRRKHTFEGVIPNMLRRYRDTESQAVRESLAKFLSTSPCPTCYGARLNAEARNVFVGEKNLPELTSLPISQALEFFQKLKLLGSRAEIAEKILKEVCDRLNFLINVGLGYLSLNRSAETLSGGEAQRIRLASQIGSGLVGVMYILDEPTVGLHQRDNERLLGTLKHLRELGNTVIVVEHDEDTILAADEVVDIGPGAGVHGGKVVFHGKPEDLLKSSTSLTGKYLTGKEQIPFQKTRAKYNAKQVISLRGASQNNLKNIDIDIPIGLFTCVTGVSGSGKSSLINDILYPFAGRHLNGAAFAEPKTVREVKGLDLLDKVVDIDQSPIGRTPRSNPATYTGLFTGIRDLFAATPEARARGYKIGRFSFNVRGGRCEACQGDGLIKVEMHFLPDIYVTCDACQGQRYNRETLEVRYKGKNIHEVLSMTVEEALEFFSAVPSLAHKLEVLEEVGLSYIRLGQSATTLSGGEAQRIKLARELSRADTGQTLYLLDEPTTGLHFHDIKQLLGVLHELRSRGNTIVVIEHNLDVIKTADWIIDLGPEGGDCGGQVVVCGTPEDIVKCKKSYTGKFLRGKL